MRDAQDWLATSQAQLLHGDLRSAQATLTQALLDHPASVELRRALAGVQQQAGQPAEAEAMLRELQKEDPGDAASAFALVRRLKEQGKTAAAGAVMRACFSGESNRRDANLAIHAIELLDDCGRKGDAAAIADAAITENPDDARLHAYAGMLQIQLGAFDQARRHYLDALQRDPRAWEWHVPIGLSSAQRYAGREHPDFVLFREGLRRDNLSAKARAELHFALGKAYDDIGDHDEAARHFREGNALAQRLTGWSRKGWRRAVEARLASQPIPQHLDPAAAFTPVFIVGMPRSGTTLLAELLSRYPKVRNRGELPWLARLAARPALSGKPARPDQQDAAAIYAVQSRQDDAGDALWFIDKQPLNFRYVDLALALFPDAKVIHCRRNRRDTALSLWMQCFLEDVQGYAYDFDDIALVMRDCDRLMAHGCRRHPDSIRTVHYEELVAAPQSVVLDLARWIGLPPLQASAASLPQAASTISTASLWQARQPVNTRSVGRWKLYAQYIPELLRFPE
jgi:tetratricopeptide (TPR) repeat protein